MQKFHLEGTPPRKVLYHNESRMLLVMRTKLNHGTYSSDICCVDPLSGSLLTSFESKFDYDDHFLFLLKVLLIFSFWNK